MAESGFLLSLLSEVLIRRLAIVQSSLVTLYLPQLHSEGDSFRRTNFLYCSLKARILWELDETRFELAHGGLLCLSGWKQCFLHLLWSSTELDFIIPTQPNLSQKKPPKNKKELQRKAEDEKGSFAVPISHLLNSDCVPGTSLSKLHESSHLILTCGIGNFIIPTYRWGNRSWE